MSIMMNPVLPAPAPELTVQSAGKKAGGESSFARHLDRQIQDKYGRTRDKLGVSDQRREARTARETKNGRAGEAAEKVDGRKEKKSASETEVPQFLGEMMSLLKQVAETKINAPGEWNLAATDSDMLQQMGLAAGMDEADFSQFMQQLQNSDDSVSLVDFLNALNSHFEEMTNVEAITVAETELPMLEAILARMGVAQEDLEALSAAAVTGDGKIDLNLLLQALEKIGNQEGLASVTLTDWESEQLQNLLAQAGVTLEQQNELLPERFLNQVLGREEAGKPVAMSMERLANMLRDGLASIRENQPKVDLPVFLADLKQILSQAEFANQGVGWTPVVEDSVNAVFQKLQELVDLARVKVEENRVAEEQALDDDMSDWFKALEKKFAQQPDGDQAADFAGNGSAGQSTEEQSANKTAVQQHQPMSQFSVARAATESSHAVENARSETFVRTPPREMQQHLFQQLSDGVMRGLRNQEHQLVLRLYPQDLGEVKVNLLVRDEHVSVSFNMENAKVKEMLESNMEEFRQSMDQKGFKLGECFVSVGQQDDGGDLWQRFESARHAVKAARASLAEVPESALYLQQPDLLRRDGRPDGISLFV